MEYMKTLNPSATDMEMRSLMPIGGGSHAAMETFLKFLSSWLDTNRDFELVQAYICLFLKISGEEIADTPSLVALLQELFSKQQQSWTRIEGHFNRTMCLINYLKSAVL
ncbi:WD repeat-containing protein 36 [Holothuria leucospilota]|uniref:WD repeat-containing protein 36 n=1 Tax=Holothuria leucospilota TaxID=206669 RepID=A0A9Q1H732_HOLLE|nr:WD repeat-containing protein 36 [Holothuria leucospilota]